ncbi:MAG: hypothetical protein IPJ65_20910 [Archangiaceae bacterium]|nr:hypothetical protein [Archangiaceae bacterium]
MLFALATLVLWLLTGATLAPLRANATCTPASHRARVGLGLVSAALAAVSVGRFIWFVLLLGHPIAQLGVLIGQLLTVTFAAQAVLLVRDVRPGRRAALGLAAWCAALAVVLTVKTVHVLSAG